MDAKTVYPIASQLDLGERRKLIRMLEIDIKPEKRDVKEEIRSRLLAEVVPFHAKKKPRLNVKSNN